MSNYNFNEIRNLAYDKQLTWQEVEKILDEQLNGLKSLRSYVDVTNDLKNALIHKQNVITETIADLEYHRNQHNNKVDQLKQKDKEIRNLKITLNLEQIKNKSLLDEIIELKGSSDVK